MLKELRQKLNEGIAAAKSILAKAESEKRALSAEEAQNYDKAIAEVNAVKADIERREGFASLEARMAAPAGEGVKPNPGDNSLGMPAKDFRKYSLLRAISLKADGKQLDGIEAEAHQEMERRSGKSAQGFFVPVEIGIERRDLTTSTGTGGVNTGVLYQDFISLLRSKLVIQALGAKYMGGLVGDFAIPRQSGGGTAYWVTEGNAPTASNQTLDSVSLSPKTVGANTLITRKFLKQTSLDAEAFVRDDLATILALEIDRAAIEGSGLNSEPEGILATTGIGSVSAGGAALTFAKVVALETAVDTSNALLGNLAYLTNGKVRGQLKTTLEAAGVSSPFIWKDDMINGYRAMATNQVPSDIGAGGTENDGSYSALIFGNFSDLIIAQWGGLDVTVDPYSQSKSGGVVVSVLQDTDIKFRHKASFAAIQDILTA